jgi:hypothetical protein
VSSHLTGHVGIIAGERLKRTSLRQPPMTKYPNKMFQNPSIGLEIQTYARQAKTTNFTHLPSIVRIV